MDSKRHVFIYDIETAISPRGEEHLKTVDLGDCGYDGRFKDPEKIEASKKEKVQEARNKLLDKAPLYWWYGRIVSISVMDVEDKESRILNFSCATLDEAGILRGFFQYVVSRSIGTPALVGKNSQTFDHGYLIGRCLCLNIGVPDFLRPYRPIDDIDQIFSMKSGAATLGKLSEYAFGIGFEKSAKGSDVAEMVRNKDWQRLVDYNNQDVVVTAEIYKRFMKDFVFDELPF